MVSDIIYNKTLTTLLPMPNIIDKIWNSHIVTEEGGRTLLYIDLQMAHEATSPQAFEGLRLAGRKLRRPDKIVATADHNTPTTPGPITDEFAKNQIDTLGRNCKEFGVRYYPHGDPKNGVVHVIAPELGLTQPGMTIVCGDSHTATYGAFGALAFGIGTSEIEHVMATQTLVQSKPKTMRLDVSGNLAKNVSPKDVILYLIGQLTTEGGTGYAIEYTGNVFREMTMEGRMTVCNMTIEAGARSGLIAPDETTFDYLRGREFAPSVDAYFGRTAEWKDLISDLDATYDRTEKFAAEDIRPQVTWGTNPGQVTQINGRVPDPTKIEDDTERKSVERALEYMGLRPGMAMTDIPIDWVFIGSCTNGRIEDLRVAAEVIKGRKVASDVTAIVVPGSGQVKNQAEAEGLDKIFTEAGMEWRLPGCSMCLAMNPDKLPAGKRCAGTSNRNFEGRMGKGSRTHLVSPALAAAAAVAGRFVAVEDL